MSAQNQAAETSKEPDDRKADPPRLKIRIRLPPRKRLANDLLTLVKEAADNTNNSPSKEAAELTDKQTPSKNLTNAGVLGEASNNCPEKGMCHDANSNALSMTLPAEAGSNISNNKLHEDVNENALSNNLTTTTASMQGNDDSTYPVKEGLCEEANNNSGEPLPAPFKELPEEPIDNIRCMDLSTIEAGVEEENNYPRKRLLYDTTSNIPSKAVPVEAKDNNLSRDFTTTAGKCEKVLEQVCKHIPTKKASGIAERNAPSSRPTAQTNKNTACKKPCTSVVETTCTVEDTSALKLSSSVGQVMVQSFNSAYFMAIKEYQNFETVKRTVHLDNSHQSTNPVITVKQTVHLDNSHQSTNPVITTALCQENDVSIYPAKEGLCEETNNNTPRKPLPVSFEELPEEPIDNIPSKNLATIAVQVEVEKNNSPIKRLLCDNTSNSTSKIVPEEAKDNNPNKNLTTSPVKCEEMFKQVCKHIPTKKLSDKAGRPTVQAKKNIRKKSYTSVVQTTCSIQHTSEMKLSSSVGQTVEQSFSAKNFTALREYQEFEELVKPTVYHDHFSHQSAGPDITTASNQSGTIRKGDDASIFPAKEGLCEEANNTTPRKPLPVSFKKLPEGPIGNTTSKNLATTAVLVEDKNNSPRKRFLYDTTSNVPSKVVPKDANDNSTHRNLTNTPVNCEEMFEQVCKHVPTKKASDKAERNAPSSIPTNRANKNTSRKRKKPCTSVVLTTSTIQNTSGIKLSSPVGQAGEQSSNATKFMAIKEYKEFEEMVKRTVYLDNISYQATEPVIRTALNQFGTVMNVSFLVNYTIPYNIPQSAFVEMETEKDAVTVVDMLNEFPFMMAGMPRPVRAKHATAEMFNDRPRRPGSKLEFEWMSPTDPRYEICKKIKLMTRRHEMENLALIKHELEMEQSLAKEQEENLNYNHEKLLSVDSVILPGLVYKMFHNYGIKCNEAF